MRILAAAVCFTKWYHQLVPCAFKGKGLKHRVSLHHRQPLCVGMTVFCTHAGLMPPCARLSRWLNTSTQRRQVLWFSFYTGLRTLSTTKGWLHEYSTSHVRCGGKSQTSLLLRSIRYSSTLQADKWSSWDAWGSNLSNLLQGQLGSQLQVQPIVGIFWDNKIPLLTKEG